MRIKSAKACISYSGIFAHVNRSEKENKEVEKNGPVVFVFGFVGLPVF